VLDKLKIKFAKAEVKIKADLDYLDRRRLDTGFTPWRPGFNPA